MSGTKYNYNFVKAPASASVPLVLKTVHGLEHMSIKKQGILE